jgi:hypothetical protein
MCHLSSRHFLFLFIGALSIVLALGQRGNCQSKLNRRPGTPASSVQLQATKLVVKLPKPFEKVPAQEMEMLHWLRVKYEVTSNGEILASGIEPLRAATS